MKRRRPSRKPLARRPRRGMTLVELVVAMTILVVGLLAVVGVSTSVARALGNSRADTLGAMAAQSRFELLAGTECATIPLAAETEVKYRGVTERYTVTDAGNATIRVVNNVSWITPGGTRSLVIETMLPCRPGA